MAFRHRCGAEWAGLSVAHCGTCCLTFRSATGFVIHRRGGRCATPAELRERGLEPNALNQWRTPRDASAFTTEMDDDPHEYDRAH